MSLIKREDAIQAVVNTPSNIADVMGNNLCLDGAVFRQNEIIDILKSIPSAEPKPVLTEEAREAIMRLTMCGRHECAICKFNNNEDDCYEIATKRMHILVDAFDKPKQGEWIPCSERLPDATGFYLCTVNRDTPNVKTMKFELLVGDEYRWLLMNGTEAFQRFVIAWMPLPPAWKGASDEVR